MATTVERPLPGAPQPVDVRQLIDDRPFSRYQLLVVVLCGAVLTMDGFDAQATGYVAPALVQQLHLARGSLGPVFSSGLLGIMLGALLFGPLADRWGRKPVLVLCTVLFGISGLLTATAGSLQALLLFRLATGFGLGGVMPNAISITSEYTPRRFRATAIVSMFCGFSLGAAGGGFMAAGLIARFGWQSIFLLGGALPCVLAVVTYLWLPESVGFLIAKGGRDARVARCLRHIAPSIPPGASFVIGEPRASGFLVKQLFTAERARLTVLLWVIFFMSLLDLYLLNNWLPTVMHDAGMAVRTAILITSLFQVGGAVGAVVLGRLIDRYRSYRVLAGTYLCASVSVFLIGMAGRSVVALAVAVFAAGFCVVGGQIASNATASAFYPTAIRSTGLGWALGVGRIGSIAGPLLGGVLLSVQKDARHLFWAAALPVLIAAAAAYLAARTSKPETLRKTRNL
jgi:AAHS family 4-hydroxybenzoate transporter-like MFS transporter